MKRKSRSYKKNKKMKTKQNMRKKPLSKNTRKVPSSVTQTKNHVVENKSKNVDKEFLETLAEDKKSKLYKAKGTPKLIIPNKVWSQIQTLLLTYHSTEWSGVLYYTDNEVNDINKLEVTAQYLFPMTIGRTSYTSFDWQKKEALCFNVGLVKDKKEWRKGCLHSH